MADDRHYFPDKACTACARMGCVYFDTRSGAAYLCAECVARSGLRVSEEPPLPEELPRGNEREELRRKSRQMYTAELARQIDIFLRLGLHTAMRMQKEWFMEQVSHYLYQLASISDLLPDDFSDTDRYPLFWEVEKKGNIPILLVVASADLDCQRRLEAVCAGIDFRYDRVNSPVELAHIQNRVGPLLTTQIYCLFNVAPKGIKGHLTLTIDEGITLASCYPDRLHKWGSLVCSASRYTQIVDTDFLFLASIWINDKSLGIFCAPQHRIRTSPEATCERRVKLVPTRPEMFWHPIGGDMKKIEP